MPTIIVDVMPKAELLDPQGNATARALGRLGHERFRNVRIGKRIELQVDEPVTDELRAEVRAIAATMLANEVIEDVVAIRFDDVATEAARAASARQTPNADTATGGH